MASLSFIRYLINCDGCGAVFGDRMGFDSLTEARSGAYAAGWRFPNLLTAQGVPSRATSDVCATCAPRWQPHQVGKKTNFQRVLSRAEVERLP